MEPPRISFFTPSGRFEVNERICVSFSDYHPELWNPSWGIESVLVGLQSFFQEECPEAIGSIMASTQTRRKLAKESHEFNVKDNMYQQLFGDQNNSIKSTTKIFGEEKKDGEEDGPYCRYCRMSGGELISPCHCLVRIHHSPIFCYIRLFSDLLRFRVMFLRVAISGRTRSVWPNGNIRQFSVKAHTVNIKRTPRNSVMSAEPNSKSNGIRGKR